MSLVSEFNPSQRYAELERILSPRSIAIVGASPDGMGGRYLEALRHLGFKGEVYAINPNRDEVKGYTCYDSLKDVPGPVDLVISCVPKSQLEQVMEDCVEIGALGAHLFTAQLTETGFRKDAALERKVIRLAKKGGVQIIGSNGMGLYNPKVGVAMNSDMPSEYGSVSLLSQSGGMLGDIVRKSARRGIRFREAVSYGNGFDKEAVDYLRHYAEDPLTEQIMMYIEGPRKPDQLFDALYDASRKKTVLVLKGGRTEAGQSATLSHTASLASDHAIWEALVKQAGALSVRHVDQMVDLMTGFYFLPSKVSENIAVVGWSGGGSVNAADLCTEADLKLPQLPKEIRNYFRAMGKPLLARWGANPADYSIATEERGDVLKLVQAMAIHPAFETFISSIGGLWRANPDNFDVNRHMRESTRRLIGNKPLLYVFENEADGSGEDYLKKMAVLKEIQERLILEGEAVFPSVERAALTLRTMVDWYNDRKEPAPNLIVSLNNEVEKAA